MAAVTSAQAHAIARRVMPATLGRPVTDAEVWALLATARAESGYGQWSSPPHAPDMVTSNNWGAVQCTEHRDRFRLLGTTDQAEAMRQMAGYATPSAVAGHCAMALDWLPGKGWFAHPYRWHATPEEGCAHLAQTLEHMGILEAIAAQPDTWTLARLQFEARYFTGKTGKAEIEIPNRAKQLADQVRAIREKLGGVASPLAITEAAPDGGAGFRDPAADRGARARLDAIRLALATRLTATLSLRRPYLRGDEVRDLQADLRARGAELEVDGILGPRTLAAWLSDPRGDQ